jgi:hypothetical protein
MVTSIAFGAHPTSDASRIGLNRAFARVYRPLGAVLSVFARPESLNPGTMMKPEVYKNEGYQLMGAAFEVYNEKGLQDGKGNLPGVS